MFAIGSNLLQNLTNPNKTGWLNKVGAVRKSVKRRWFVLKDFTVAYFTSREVRVTFDKTDCRLMIVLANSLAWCLFYPRRSR